MKQLFTMHLDCMVGWKITHGLSVKNRKLFLTKKHTKQQRNTNILEILLRNLKDSITLLIREVGWKIIHGWNIKPIEITNVRNHLVKNVSKMLRNSTKQSSSITIRRLCVSTPVNKDGTTTIYGLKVYIDTGRQPGVKKRLESTKRSRVSKRTAMVGIMYLWRRDGFLNSTGWLKI